MKPKIALVRGKFLNKYEMQFYEPLVSSWDITGFGSLAPFHRQFDFPVISLPCPMDIPDFPKKMSIINRVFTDAHYLYGLEQQLEGFDIAHCAETYYRYTQQALHAKQQGKVKKVIATVLENIPFSNEGIRGRAAYKENARRNLDHIIALTERTKTALLLEGADEKKITVISHFIDTDRFHPGPSERSDRHLTILFCGRLERYKGVYELVYAARLLLSDPELQEYTLRFSFVGDGSEKKNVLALESKLGIRKHISHTNVTYENMPDLYQKADIYVAPSTATETWQEQYNTTLLEAQASGLPIVTTLSGGISENVGNAAVLIQPSDTVSLVRELKIFILNKTKRQEYGKRARSRALTVHDKRIGAKKVEAVYNTVLAQ